MFYTNTHETERAPGAKAFSVRLPVVLGDNALAPISRPSSVAPPVPHSGQRHSTAATLPIIWRNTRTAAAERTPPRLSRLQRVVYKASTVTLKLHNTLTHQLEEFRPLDPEGKRVLLYSCGPTVYSFAHIGNFRSFLLSDLLRRVLERRGYQVRHVMNVTDVGHMTEDHLADAAGEDKLSKAARELGWDPFVVARHFESAFVEDAAKLRLRNFQGDERENPSLHPRATRFIPEMLQMVQQLLERQFAYLDSSGQVYFEIAKFPAYGQLSKKNIEELEAGSRVAVREEKKDPRDFALWKTDAKHLMQWDPQSGQGFEPEDWDRFKKLCPEGIDPRIGRGFPGWHIECSAMCMSCLGQTIDIHTGGEDNIFPHHECEIAQTCGVLDEQSGEAPSNFARYWIHGRHLLVNNRKMSKRDGTFFTVRELLDPRANGRDELAAQLDQLGFAQGKVPAPVLRYALMSCSYRAPMNFSFDLLQQAKSQVAKLQTRYERLVELVEPTELVDGDVPPEASAPVRDAIERCRTAFDTALDDNLDLASAMAAAGHFVGELNQLELSARDANTALQFMDELDDVLDVLVKEVRAGIVDQSTLQAWLDESTRTTRLASLQSPVLDQIQTALSTAALPELSLAASNVEPALIEALIGLRHTSKKQKRFDLADAIRQALQGRGVALEDRPDGVRWKLD